MAQSLQLPPLNWLRAFEAAARHLSFTSAAAELNLTQSAVSQHVRSLERHLRRTLFVRGARALQLTESGANFLPTVQEAFETLASGARVFQQDRRGGHLRVQCNMAFSTFWLAPRLSELFTRYDWMTLDITTPIWDPERHAGDADLEIRFMRPNNVPGSAVRLGLETYFPVCRPDNSTGADWRDCHLFDCSGVMGDWRSWVAAQGAEFPAGKQINYGSSYVFSITAALNGAGMAMGHDSLCDDLLRNGSLELPFDGRESMPEAYYLIVPGTETATPATRAFSEWLQASFAARRI